MRNQSVEPKSPALPGNKRQRPSRAAELVWTDSPELELRLLSRVEGPARKPGQTVAPPTERAAVLDQLPAMILVGSLQRDEDFLCGLENVVSGQPTTDDLAARYQRRGSYGFCVMLALIEDAVQTAAQCRSVSSERLRASLRQGLVKNMTTRGYFPDASVEPGHRQRWRIAAGRDQAVETLLLLGAGRCLAPGCRTVLRFSRVKRFYCGVHSMLEPSLDRGKSSSPTAGRHDAAIARVAALLQEVGAKIKVPPRDTGGTMNTPTERFSAVLSGTETA